MEFFSAFLRGNVTLFAEEARRSQNKYTRERLDSRNKCKLEVPFEGLLWYIIHPYQNNSIRSLRKDEVIGEENVTKQYVAAREYEERERIPGP